MQDISFCIMHKNKEQMNGKKKKKKSNADIY